MSARKTVQKNGIPFHVTYNAPVTLTFALLAALILLADTKLFNHTLCLTFFTAPSRQGTPHAFNWKNVFDYVRLFIHVLGHADWNHLMSNLSFILLLGPLLEERYSSRMLLLMITITALVTGVINACFLDTALMGASGIVFMMILLASFTSVSQHEIPLSFILIMILYIGRQLFSMNNSAGIATFAHITGGICGSIFGFLIPYKPAPAAKRRTAPAEE